jgi:hypothetical protein
MPVRLHEGPLNYLLVSACREPSIHGRRPIEARLVEPLVNLSVLDEYPGGSESGGP